MDGSWVTAMDSLAAGGVIDFDAPAYILGTTPRYVGNPSLGSLPMENPVYLKGAQLKNNLNCDEFNYNGQANNKKKKNSILKWIGGIAAAAAIVTCAVMAMKGKIKIPEKLKNIKNFDFGKYKKSSSEFFGNILETIKKPFVLLKNKFSGSKPPVDPSLT